ncbi:helix-turn-helix domain-containing protein [Nocardioides carbamazepini]|uniref:helix-turn-helix domain-containing protein n=1 Tax=Nocardioides carbamazepini TaxID=2854259 RepID=UPI002149C5D2|nr:AraC family transcriptional regulator [Nocardioides carbamazepini]
MTTRAAQAERERSNRLLLRARDLMDRSYAEPLDVDALARVAHCSPAHFIRTFRAAFGETPYRYLQRRRIERAMALLRTSDEPVQEICVAVGWTNLATFTRTFRRVVGVPPSAYRAAVPAPPGVVPTCFAKAWERPSSFGTTPRSRPA